MQSCIICWSAVSMKLQVPPGQTPSLILSICPTIADVSNCKVSVQQLDVNEQTGPSLWDASTLSLMSPQSLRNFSYQLTSWFSFPWLLASCLEWHEFAFIFMLPSWLNFPFLGNLPQGPVEGTTHPRAACVGAASHCRSSERQLSKLFVFYPRFSMPRPHQLKINAAGQ